MWEYSFGILGRCVCSLRVVISKTNLSGSCLSEYCGRVDIGCDFVLWLHGGFGGVSNFLGCDRLIVHYVNIILFIFGFV